MAQAPQDVVALKGVAALVIQVDGGSRLVDEFGDVDAGVVEGGMDRRLDASVAQPTVARDEALAMQFLGGGVVGQR